MKSRFGPFGIFLFFITVISNTGFSQHLQWANTIGGERVQIATSMALDTMGNVFLTGYITSTVDFDPGPGTAYSNDSYVDVFIAKYDKFGEFKWVKVIGGVSIDQSFDLVLDKVGNIYITGFFRNTVDFDPNSGTAFLNSVGVGVDIFLAKYDNSGNYIWAKRVGSTTSSDESHKIAVDSVGYVYVIGTFRDTADLDPGLGIANLQAVGQTDIFIAKYDGNGDFIWAKSIGGTQNDDGSDIRIDTLGNIYITGYFQDTVDFDPGSGTLILASLGERDIYFAKYDNHGNFLWAKIIGSAGRDQCHAIALDEVGNIYLAGFFSDTVDFDQGIGIANLSSGVKHDIFLAKYDGSGVYIWAKNIASIEYAEGFYFALDTASNIYVTGYFEGQADFDPGPNTANLSTIGQDDIFLAKYDRNGNYLWATGIGGDGDEHGINTAITKEGDLYLAGNFESEVDFDPSPAIVAYVSKGATDIFFAKYDSSVISAVISLPLENSIRVYPNPNDGKFTIDIAEIGQNLKDGKIEIYSMLGEKLHSEKIKSSQSITVNLTLPQGMYILRIATKEEETLEKIVIQ